MILVLYPKVDLSNNGISVTPSSGYMLVVDDEGAKLEHPAVLLQELFEKIDEKEPGQKMEIIVDRKVSLVFLSFFEGFVCFTLFAQLAVLEVLEGYMRAPADD